MANATKEDLKALEERITQRFAGQLKMISAIRKSVDGKTVKERNALVPPGECVQGLDPKNCTEASTYNYQHGCHGASCDRVVSEYYGKNGDTPVKAPAKKTTAKKTAAPKSVAKKTVAKKTVAKAAAPKTVAKKTVPRKPVPKKTVAASA